MSHRHTSVSFLGIDIGSSSIKGGVLDVNGRSIHSVCSRPFPQQIANRPATWFEVDAESIVASVQLVIRDLLIHCSAPAGIVFTCQMGGVLLVDESGAPLSPYLSWRDQRTMAPATSSDSESVFQEVQRRTTPEDRAAIGNELRPGSAATLLYWLSRTGSFPVSRARAVTLGDFVTARLCNSPPRIEPTMALGLLNLRTQQFHHDWLNRLGCSELLWPELTDSLTRIGSIDVQGLEIPCYPAVGDHQTALLGAGLRPGDLSLNISTGSQVSMVTEIPELGDYQTRPYFGGRFLNTITHLPAGRSLNALVDLLTELSTTEGTQLRDPWSAISAATERVTSTDLEIDLSFFAGSMGDRGCMQNMKLENLSVGHLFVAAFTNMAHNYALCAKRLTGDRSWKQVVLSGGLPQKLPRLRSILAERFPGPMRTPQIVEEALEGLLQLAHDIHHKETGSH
ncbi:MAG: hypothetical protein JNL58_14105 [Planctomyces sp.]|nr:hypothetical protein [Planctomyces sp.]